MFVRAKKSGAYQYLRLVHNQRGDGKVSQQVVATVAGQREQKPPLGVNAGVQDLCGLLSGHIVEPGRVALLSPVRFLSASSWPS